MVTWLLWSRDHCAPSWFHIRTALSFTAGPPSRSLHWLELRSDSRGHTLFCIKALVCFRAENPTERRLGSDQQAAVANSVSVCHRDVDRPSGSEASSFSGLCDKARMKKNDGEMWLVHCRSITGQQSPCWATERSCCSSGASAMNHAGLTRCQKGFTLSFNLQATANQKKEKTSTQVQNPHIWLIFLSQSFVWQFFINLLPFVFLAPL